MNKKRLFLDKNLINNRGLSEIVSSVLLIVLTISALGAIAGFVVPYVRENLNEGTSCVGFEEYVDFKNSIEYKNKEYFLNCDFFYDRLDIRRIGLIVKGPEKESDKIKGIQIALQKSSGESESIKLIEGESYNNVHYVTEANDELQLEDGPFQMPGQGAFKTYIIDVSDRTNNYTSASVSIINQEDRVCPQIKSLELFKCDDNLRFFSSSEISDCVAEIGSCVSACVNRETSGGNYLNFNEICQRECSANCSTKL